MLMVTTLFPHANVVGLARNLGLSFVVGAVATFVALRWLGRKRREPRVLDQPAGTMAKADRATWRMPPLALLEPVTWSLGTRLSMLALRGYLVVGATLLAVKAIQLGSG
jgi:hypothetical protein